MAKENTMKMYNFDNKYQVLKLFPIHKVKMNEQD